MARPFKVGLSYFPLDTDFFSDRKIQRLARKYGCNGICTYQAVLCEIYRENGYYISFDENFYFDIGFTLGLDEALVKEIIVFCVQLRLFDSELMESYRVLSSIGIQRRFREVNKRRWCEIKPELEIPETEVNVTETPVSAATTPTKEKDNKIEKTTSDGKSNENESSTDQGESDRKAELLRMAQDATRGR